MNETNPMLEKVARAIWDKSQIGNISVETTKFEDLGESALCYRLARAVIEAIRAELSLVGKLPVGAGRRFDTDAEIEAWGLGASQANAANREYFAEVFPILTPTQDGDSP